MTTHTTHKTTIRAAAVVLALAATVTGSQAALAASATHVKEAAIVASPITGKGVVHVLFRTDHALGRRAPGQGFLANVHVGQRVASIGSASRHPRCYEAFVKAPSLKVGEPVAVRFFLGDRSVTRTLTLKRSSADTPATIGC